MLPSHPSSTSPNTRTYNKSDGIRGLGNRSHTSGNQANLAGVARFVVRCLCVGQYCLHYVSSQNITLIGIVDAFLLVLKGFRHRWRSSLTTPRPCAQDRNHSWIVSGIYGSYIGELDVICFPWRTCVYRIITDSCSEDAQPVTGQPTQANRRVFPSQGPCAAFLLSRSQHRTCPPLKRHTHES